MQDSRRSSWSSLRSTLPERKPLMLGWRTPLSRRQMTSVEGVTLREAVEWCGDQIGVREATRLRP